MDNIIKIEMNTADAEAFVAYNERKEAIDTLINAGVFELKDATALLNFSPQGVLTQITVTSVPFKRQNKVRFVNFAVIAPSPIAFRG